MHSPRYTMPLNRVLIPIEIPDELVTMPTRLPGDWKTAPDSARTFGDRWIQAASSLALFVPSAVLTKEHNVLINPAHPDFPRIRVRRPEANFLDSRLFQ